MSSRNKSRNNNKSSQSHSNLRYRKTTQNSSPNNNISPSNKNKNNKNRFSDDMNECPFECDCKNCQFKIDRKSIAYYREYIIDNLYSSSPYRLRNFHFIIDLILFGIGAIYVVAVPYTKVEESFNMQATHDMLFYGYFDLRSYDHFDFPGIHLLLTFKYVSGKI